MNLEERKLKKRIISLLLCLCMVFSLLPTVVFASEAETTFEWDQSKGCYLSTTGSNEPQSIKVSAGLPETLKTLYNNIYAAETESAKKEAIQAAKTAGTISADLADRLERLVHVYTGDELASGVRLQDGSFTATLNGDELVISGTGALPTYTRYNDDFWAPADNSVAMRPWNTEKLGPAVSSVRFGDGITNIGGYAFWKNVTGYDSKVYITTATFNSTLNVHLPDSLTQIDHSTFLSLEADDIAVPANVAQLSTRLFRKVSRLYVLGDPEISVIANAPRFGTTTNTTVYIVKDSKLSKESRITNMDLVEVDAIGACGADAGYSSELVWTVQGNTLSITAMDGSSGKMENYTSASPAPWNTYAGQITKVVLSAGVTSIGTDAFAGLNKLTEVTVPTSVEIEEDAASPFGTTPLASISFNFNADSSFAAWLKKKGIEDSADVDALGRRVLTMAENELFHAYIGTTDIAAKLTNDGVLTIYPTYSATRDTVVPSIGGWHKDNTAYPWFNEVYGKDFSDPAISGSNWNGTTTQLENLKKVVWDKGITDTGAYLFNEAKPWPSTAVEFQIPDSVTIIGAALNGGLRSAGEVCVVPENVTSLGWGFGGNSAKDVYILNPDLTNIPYDDNAASGKYNRNIVYATTDKFTVHVKAESDAYAALNRDGKTYQNVTTHTDMGACGVAPYSSEVFWLYDESTKTLTIKGSGAMRDYASTYAAPWAYYDVETVTVEAGITQIGAYAFASLKKITKDNVTLDSNVKVADTAFAKPDAQGRLPLPQSDDLYFNEYIGDTTIAAKMSKADGVLTIYPTDKNTVVPSIKGYRGDNTAYPWFEMYKKTYPTKDPKTGLIPEKDWNTFGPYIQYLKKIVWANGITETGAYLFNMAKTWPSGVVEFRVPDSVTKIGGALNGGSKNAGELCIIPENVKSVGWGFGGNKATDVYILNPNLTDIPYDTSSNQNRNIIYASTDKFTVHVKEGSAAYAALTQEGKTYQKVTTHTDLGACGVVPYSSEVIWVYDANSKTLTVLGDGAIRDYDSADEAPWSSFNVETLVVQDGITRIGNNAFAALKNLKTVNVDGSVTEVADTAFATENGKIVDSLKKTQFLTSSDAMKAWLKKYGTSALGTSGVCDGYRWSIESGVLTIKVDVTDADTTDVLGAGGKTAAISDVIAEGAPDWVAYKSIITKVQLGYGITGIGANAFADMPVLSDVELPSTLVTIGAEAFVNTPKLTKLYLPKKASVADTAFGTASSAEKAMTIQISPVAPAAQKDIQSQGNTTITVDSSKNLNVLLIGNSYFGALSGYLKDIARGLGATDAMIANYYFGGYAGNLESYVKYINAGKVSYKDNDTYSGYKENSVPNHSYNNNPLSMGIEAEDWDYVVMETWGKNEPAGANGGGKLSQDPNLTTLKEYILKYAPQAKVSLYHVYSCRYLAEKEEPVETLTEQWQRYVNGADDGLAKIVAHVIPASTLIQNARLTYLNADGGDLLRNPKPTDGSNPDITHLNREGDYINAIMMYEMLTGKSAADFDHGTFDNHKEAFYHKLVDVTKAAGMKKLTYAYVEHNNTINYYNSLAEAANAAVAGDTLSLLAMPKSETPLTLASGITVETFGSSEDHTIVLTNGGNITENGLVAFAGCEVDDSAEAAAKAIAVNPVTGALQEVEIELPPVKVKVYVTPYADGNPVTPAQTSTVLGTYDAAKGAFFSGTLTTRQILSGDYDNEYQNPFKAVIGELETSGFAPASAAVDTDEFYQIAWAKLTETEDGYEMNGTVVFYDVQFDVNGGDTLDPDPSGYYLLDTVITLPTPTRTGYSFVEWKEAETSGDGGEIDWAPGTLSLDDEDAETDAANTGTYTVEGAVTLVAQWQPNKYTVSFDANGGEPVSETKTLGYGSKYGNLPTTTREGYTFLGWFTAAEGGQQIGVDVKTVRIAEDHKLYAHWEKKEYTVVGKLYLNGKPVMKADGTSQYLSTPLTGLYGDAIDYTSTKTWAENLVLTDIDLANEPIKATVKIYKDGGTWDPSATFGNPDVSPNYVWVDVTTYYEVVFNTSVEGLAVGTKTVKYGDKVEKPEDPTREGYEFLGWFEKDAEESFNFDTPIKHKTELTARWEKKTYTVTFDPNGGAVEPTSKTVTFDDAYGDLPTPTRAHHTFKGWYLGTDKVTEATIVKTAENHTLRAAWSRSYYALTINYVDKKGNPVADSYEASVALGADFSVTSPVVKGYKLRDKDDAVIEGTMTAEGYTYDVVYVKKSSGGSGVQIESPNKPKQDNSLKFNTAEHFAFVNGYPDGTVKPNGNVTRAEVAAILYRVMDADCVKTYETTRCSFSDVVRGDWFNLYVATLENAGVIVDTRTNGKFRPNEAITRAELAAMLAQFADIKSAANSFNDVSARHWASDEIAVCAKMGWINGYPDGSFRPDATITRAEMMAMINRALGRTPKSADDLLSGMKTWRDNANVNAWYYLDVQEATNSHTYTKSGSHESWKKLR